MKGGNKYSVHLHIQTKLIGKNGMEGIVLHCPLAVRETPVLLCLLAKVLRRRLALRHSKEYSELTSHAFQTELHVPQLLRCWLPRLKHA